MGRQTLRTKSDFVKYLKDAFAYGHRAMRSMEEKKSSVERVSMAISNVAHVYGHYGQMAVFARMNFVVPPASRGQ